MNELALFAGAGGGILGGHLLGWRTVCAVECDPYACGVLVARQNEGVLPPFPIWDDVRTFDGRPWRGRVDVVSGGFPCQDISAAGKGVGITGQRSGLWSEMARIVGEVRPRYVFVENSPLLVQRGLAAVLSDLAALGHDARWGVVGAHHAGAPHKRDRIWIVAHANGAGQPAGVWRGKGSGAPEAGNDPGGRGADVPNAHVIGRDEVPFGFTTQGSEPEPGADVQEQGRGAELANADCIRLEVTQPGEAGDELQAASGTHRGIGWWLAEPELGRVAHGVASRVDRLKCIGNGQVPAVCRLAWELLTADE